MTSNPKIKCKRCGKCCVVLDSKGLPKPCRYLLHYVSGKTRCIIYMHRIGVIIGKDQFCNSRRYLPCNIPDCPYNKEGLPPQSEYLNTKRRYIISD